MSEIQDGEIILSVNDGNILLDWLLTHEKEIALRIHDYGCLQPIFREVVRQRTKIEHDGVEIPESFELRTRRK